MKLLFLPLIALIAVSCGKTDVSQTGVGQIRSSQAVTIGTDDLIVFDRICQAFVRKEQLYSASIPAPVTFTLNRQDCDGVDSGPVDQTVIVDSTSGNFLYRVQASNAPFVFSNAETSTSGLMMPFCHGGITNPVQKGADYVWITRSVSQSDCPTLPNEECIGFETGSSTGEEGKYRIHTRELLRINTLRTSPRYGLFTFRKAVSNIGCSDKKLSSSVSAVLK